MADSLLSLSAKDHPDKSEVPQIQTCWFTAKEDDSEHWGMHSKNENTDSFTRFMFLLKDFVKGLEKQGLVLNWLLFSEGLDWLGINGLASRSP